MGVPVAVTVKLPALPARKVEIAALVITGACPKTAETVALARLPWPQVSTAEPAGICSVTVPGPVMPETSTV